MNMTNNKKQYTKPEAEMIIFFTEEDIAALPLSENIDELSQPFYGEEIVL